jgi:hypothetical protein
MDCTIAANTSSTYCTCKLDKSNSNPACASFNASNPTAINAVTPTTAGSTGTPKLDLNGGRPDPFAGLGAGGGAGSASGGGGGGSPTSGGGGGGGGKSGGADKAPTTGKTGLNANILGGDGGGFGGGGGGGRSGGGDPRLEQFMPGGKNDPNRAPAAKASEVDKAGGKDIFLKVHEAADSQRSTLFGSRF